MSSSSLFIDLQGDNIAKESARGVLRDVLPAPLAEFLSPRGSVEWDAPMFGGPIAAAAGPRPGGLRPPATSPRQRPTPRRGISWRTSWRGATTGPSPAPGPPTAGRGSPTTCTCICACPASGTGPASMARRGRLGRRRTVIGVTVPGGPGIVVGSNGRIAWGFTNTQGDWSDLIELDIPSRATRPLPDSRRPQAIRTPSGDHPGQGTAGRRPDGRVDDLGPGHRRRTTRAGSGCSAGWPCDPNGVDLGLLDLSRWPVAGGGPGPGQPLRCPASEHRDRR